MPTATIKVDFLNPPKGKGVSWNIKTPDQTYYGIGPDLKNQVQQGGTYEVEYKENGRYKDITKVLGQVAASAPGASAGNNTYRRTDPIDACRMYVTAVTTAFIKAGKVPNSDPDMLATIGRNAVLAFKEIYRRADDERD